MVHLDEQKLKRLHTASELFDAEYGKPGTKSRCEFEKKALAYYHSVILHDQCNEETLEAMREVLERSQELETLDIDHFDEFVKSL